MARVYCKSRTLSFDPATNTYTVEVTTKDGRKATASGPTYGAAQKNAREAVLAQPAPVSVPVAAPVPNSVPVAAPVQGSPDQLVAAFAQLMMALGVDPKVIQAPVAASAPAPVPVQAPAPVQTPAPVPKSNGVLTPKDKDWHVVHAHAIFSVRELQKQLGFNGKGFSERVDLYMKQHNCEPLYEGRTHQESRRINKSGAPLVKPILKQLKEEAKTKAA